MLKVGRQSQRIRPQASRCHGYSLSAIRKDRSILFSRSAANIICSTKGQQRCHATVVDARKTRPVRGLSSPSDPDQAEK